MIECPEILVVDDITDSARDYAELIRVKYKLKAISTSNVSEAINFVKQYNIKVVVLDQVMPEMKGTELFAEIKKIKLDIKALILTGEASPDDIGMAMNVGFDEYLGKENIAQLPEKVLKLYTRYEIDLLKKHQGEGKVEIYREKTFIPFLSKKYFLISIIPLNENHIFNNNWKTKATINVGAEEVWSEVYEWENQIIIEEQIQEILESEFKLSKVIISDLSSKLNLTINTKYSLETREKITKTVSKKYSLPPIPNDLSQKHIVRSTIEVSPVYIEYSVLLETNCPFCKKTQLLSFIAYKQIEKVMTRQTYYYSDSSSNQIETGIQTL